MAVLWTMALLSALAMATAVTFRGFAGIVTIERDRVRTEGLLTAGLETAAGLIAKLGEGRPLYEIELAFTLSTGRVHARVTDEGGRIDIGKAPRELLASLFQRAGADDGDGVARAVIEWRTRNGGAATPRPAQMPTTQRQSPRSPAGSAQQPAQEAIAATPAGTMPFTDIRQLLNVPGVTPDLIAAAAPFITVFGGDKINALTAPSSVLAMLPGMNEGRLAAFLDTRRNMSADVSQLAGILGPAQPYALMGGNKVASIVLRAELPDGYAAAAQAVIVPSPQDGQPYRVLVWNPWPAGLARR